MGERVSRLFGKEQQGKLGQYTLSDPRRLNAYVQNLENQGTAGFIKPAQIEDLTARLDAKEALKHLPPGMTPDDFAGVLRLSLLTECATETYAREFEASSVKYDQPWLGRFTRKIWTPDELSHHVPFKRMLMQMGFTEAELDRQIKEAQERDYVHQAGDTPAGLTGFGMEQEELTRNWYQETRGVLKGPSPVAAQMVGLVEGREALHTRWYKDMTAMQIEENPTLVVPVARALSRFQMPGNTVAPELQDRAEEWLSKMDADLEEMKARIVHLTAQVARTPDNAGRLVMAYAADQGKTLGPVRIAHIDRALNLLGGAGYGLIGEAMMMKVGGEKFFTPHDEGMVGKVRGVLRSKVSESIHL